MSVAARWGLVGAMLGGFVLALLLLPAKPLKAQQVVDIALTDVAYATFAGGCFWCMEKPFDQLDGVISTTSGYAGGSEKAPTYETVSSGRTGHTEVVQIAYDPSKVTFAQLLDVFWRNIDPFAVNRQFCDAGLQYRSAIFYSNAAELAAAEASKAALEKQFDQPIATQIAPLNASFTAAEEYHQDYYLKNPLRYRYYRGSCGRDDRLQAIWGEAKP
ncbi:MAG: peptide-methionine (S)-S-oxide reductase MsrA [Pseudomarimonas sp.]